MKTDLLELNLTNAQKSLLFEIFEKIEYPKTCYRTYLNQLQDLLNRLDFMFKDLFENKSLSRGYQKYGLVKITNLPQDQIDLKAPKNGSDLKLIPKKTYISENVLTFFSLIFGRPYSVQAEGQGLINNLIPKQSSHTSLTGIGSKNELGWHIENTALQYATKSNCSPQYLTMIGVTQDPAPPPPKQSLQMLEKLSVY